MKTNDVKVKQPELENAQQAPIHDEDAITKELIEELRETLDFMHSVTNEELLEHVEETVITYAREHAINSSMIKRIVDRMYNAFRGLGALQPLLDDPSITEVMVNNHEEIFMV